ncbi:unnamed protein product [Ectocarpus sp. 12 AP-2014]
MVWLLRRESTRRVTRPVKTHIPRPEAAEYIRAPHKPWCKHTCFFERHGGCCRTSAGARHGPVLSSIHRERPDSPPRAPERHKHHEIAREDVNASELQPGDSH